MYMCLRFPRCSSRSLRAHAGEFHNLLCASATNCPRDQTTGDDVYPRRNGSRRSTRQRNGGDERRSNEMAETKDEARDEETAATKRLRRNVVLRETGPIISTHELRSYSISQEGLPYGFLVVRHIVFELMQVNSTVFFVIQRRIVPATKRQVTTCIRNEMARNEVRGNEMAATKDEATKRRRRKTKHATRKRRRRSGCDETSCFGRQDLSSLPTS